MRAWMMDSLKTMLLILLVQLTGCTNEPAITPARPGEQPKEKKMITLVLSKDIEGESIEVAKISFDEANKGDFSPIGDGPEVDEAKQHWQETSSEQTLLLETARETEIDGDEVTEYLSQVVRPGDEDYPWAVYDHLQRTYHYAITVEQPVEE